MHKMYLDLGSAEETPSSPANDRNNTRFQDQLLRRKVAAPKTFNTPLGTMNRAQYAAYVASLTPRPIKRNYEVLECGHQFTNDFPPRHRNCETCWTEFFTANYGQLVGVIALIDEGKERDLVLKFGAKYIKWAKRVSATLLVGQSEAEGLAAA
jgi:hypothetical protein